MACVPWFPGSDVFVPGYFGQTDLYSCDRYGGSALYFVLHPSECNRDGQPPIGRPYTPPCPPGGGDPPRDPPTSPIILDLDGDGVKADTYAFFDYESDSFFELSRWAEVDDGVLVWDRNADGVINDGSELFGNNTILKNGNKAEHGFAALADLDSNDDGVIDTSDTAWANLQVMRWTDSDNDGTKDSVELVSLATVGVQSLNTSYVNSNHVDANYNQHRQVGNYTKTDGSTATMTDVWFAIDSSITKYDKSTIPTHSATIKELPDIGGDGGLGRVYGLRDAMALDDATDINGNSRLTAPYYSNSRTETRSLREMVEAWTATNADGTPNLDKTAREALATKILLRWAGAEGAVGRDYWGRWSRSNTQMSYTTADKVAVVEAFQGEQWLKGSGYRNPAYSTAQKVERGYLNYF